MHSVLAVGAMIAAPTARTGQMFWTPIWSAPLRVDRIKLSF